MKISQKSPAHISSHFSLDRRRRLVRNARKVDCHVTTALRFTGLQSLKDSRKT